MIEYDELTKKMLKSLESLPSLENLEALQKIWYEALVKRTNKESL